MGLFLLCLPLPLCSGFKVSLSGTWTVCASLISSRFGLFLKVLKYISSCNTVTAGLSLDGGSFFLAFFHLLIGIVGVILEGTGSFSPLC